MAFEMQYKDAIQQRMKEQFAKISDKADYEGSFSRDLINANSIEFENVYAEMNLIIDAAFAFSSWGEYLTARCAEFGVDRKQAVKAKGEVTFSGGQGVYIQKGSLVSVKNGVQFETDKDIMLDGDGKGTVKITCTDVGTKGNVQAHTINNLPISISGITSVDNEKATQDGADEETDEELLKRYSVIVRTPATSGNKYHYYNWAMSIAGVGGCRVVPLWNGAGTVKIIIINAEMQSAGADLVKAVKDYIESVRPIGADVTVVSPAPKTINISVDVLGKVDNEAFKKTVNKYISSKNLDMRYISAAQIGKLLMEQNITDYRNLKLNGADKVTATDAELLSVGNVTVNEFTAFE
jgi:baseplate J-like protein|nr:MAG TPA: Baseplate J like protein [Caudoviricetes sp.]